MPRPTEYSFIRYLDAKRPIDDAALNRHVWSALSDEVAHRHRAYPHLQVLELGAGTGSMIERIAGDLLVTATYTAVEASSDLVRVGIERVRAWALRHGLRCAMNDDGEASMAIEGEIGDRRVQVGVDWICANAFDWLAAQQQETFDLVVAHAFLDLVDAPRLLDLLRSVTRQGTLFYFSLNFDGATILLPEVGGDMDDRIESLYHASMDARRVNGQPSGDSRTGRRLFGWLRDAGIAVVAAGSSDWVVHPTRGVYPGDTAYFLYHILHFFESSLAGAPGLDPRLFTDWLDTRRSQIERGELVYIAHQLDLLGVR